MRLTLGPVDSGAVGASGTPRPDGVSCVSVASAGLGLVETVSSEWTRLRARTTVTLDVHVPFPRPVGTTRGSGEMSSLLPLSGT